MDEFDPNNPQNKQPQPVGPGGAQAQPNRAQQKGTGFTNLSRIIGANKSNQLSSAVGGGIANQVDRAKTSMNTGMNQFQEKAAANTLSTDENKQKVQTMVNGPTQATDQDVSQFETFRAGRYDGPQGLENKNEVINQSNQAATLGNMAGSAEGRQGLLQRFVGGAGYTPGKQRLDSMLLGQSGQQDLKGVYRDARALTQQAGTTVNAAEQQAKLIAGQNKQFGQNTIGTLNSAVNRVGSDIDSATQAYNTARTADEQKIDQLKKALAFDPNNQTNAISQEDYDFLATRGYDPNAQAMNLDVGNYLQLNKIGQRQDLANQQQAARVKSLRSLSGSDLSEAGASLATTLESNKDTLGNLIGKKASSFNKDQFGNDIRSVQDSRTNELLSKVYSSGSGIPGSQGAGMEAIKARYAQQGITDPNQIYAKEQERTTKLQAAKDLYNKMNGSTATPQDSERFYNLMREATGYQGGTNNLSRPGNGSVNIHGSSGSTDIGQIGDYGHFFNNQAGWASEALGDAASVRNNKNFGSLRKIITKPKATQ